MNKTWHRKPCDECGQESLASRGDPVAVDAPHLCEGCEMYDRGYRDGADRLEALVRRHLQVPEGWGVAEYVDAMVRSFRTLGIQVGTHIDGDGDEAVFVHLPDQEDNADALRARAEAAERARDEARGVIEDLARALGEPLSLPDECPPLCERLLWRVAELDSERCMARTEAYEAHSQLAAADRERDTLRARMERNELVARVGDLVPHLARYCECTVDPDEPACPACCLTAAYRRAGGER